MNRPQSSTPTDWELVLLKILWNSGPQKADEIRDALANQGIERSDSSIRTILRKMTEKGLVRITQKEKAGVYHANVERKKMEKKIIHHIKNVLFDGNMEEFAMRAFEESNLSLDIIKEMQNRSEKSKKEKE